ncbi:hypothetical protein [Streptomyces sp. NBC_01353]|uniref:hypothetical protein n=1 Tax=Streptomyces sp. NBC_01353 TaxID=2903835 RepID=UPI002E32D6D7|nr:hypothetical protein [Streptomyces sp. NBC_01353]
MTTAGDDRPGAEPAGGGGSQEHSAPKPPDKDNHYIRRDFIHVLLVILAILALGAVLSIAGDGCTSNCVDP